VNAADFEVLSDEELDQVVGGNAVTDAIDAVLTVASEVL
jgi:bacteriocin-like protein